jgi:RHS repeat-associated protein
MRSAIKYQDKHQNEVIFVISGTHFSKHFLQKKRLSEFSGFRSAHDISPYNKPFTFTGKERDTETGFSYFGARYYDSDLSGLFLSVDPMADKYPSISPYAYCAWNPVKLVDDDGRKIKFASTATKKQIAQFFQAVTYLNNHNCGGRFGQLKKSRYTYTISFVDDISKVRFAPNTRTIYWAPELGLLTDEGIVLSPSTVLNHEMTHATRKDDIDNLRQDCNKKEYHKQKEVHDKQTTPGSSKQYDTIEDEQIINGVERRTATLLGEIEEGQVTRRNHKGKAVTVANPTSNKPLNNNDNTTQQ